MGLVVTMDFGEADRFGKMAEQFGRRLMEEVSRQTLYFISSIQKNQMTGRKGEIYLNVDTGNLRRSWFPETRFRDGVITTKAMTNVKYAAIHQYGGTIKRPARQAILSFGRGRAGFVKPSKAKYQQKVGISEGVTNIPKRLFVIEQFEREMPERYKNACIKVLESFKNG